MRGCWAPAKHSPAGLCPCPLAALAGREGDRSRSGNGDRMWTGVRTGEREGWKKGLEWGVEIGSRMGIEGGEGGRVGNKYGNGGREEVGVEMG